jgi:drug/metabolite transporter (DMT)-like permease
VTAIGCGLAAAFCFGTSTLASARSARLIGSASVVAWMMIVGLAINLPLVLATGVPSDMGANAAAWLAVAGAGNVGGLLVVYAALRIERVGIVAPICSTEGAIAALIAAARGEAISGGTGAALAVIPVGVVLASIRSDEDDRRHSVRGSVLAITAAGIFGTGIYAAGRVSTEVPLTWAMLPPRAVGVLVIALPLIATSRIRLSRRAVPLVVTSGLAEVAGFAFLTLGSRHGIAITAVFASQFAAVSALGGYLFFGERLNRIQLLGVLVIAAGVAALTAVRASS